MSYCSKCGKEILAEAVVCPHCGVPTGVKMPTSSAQDDANNPGLNFLAFMIPLVGLIMYFVFQQNYPIKAKGVLKWTLISFSIGIVASIFYGCTVANFLY